MTANDTARIRELNDAFRRAPVTPDVVLICPRDRAQDVKKLVESMALDDRYRDLL